MAFAMMLVFSVAAMAAGVTTLKANVENGFVKATWTKDATATDYTVVLKDGTTVLETTPVVQPTEGTVVSFTSAAAVTESKKYTLIITSNGVTAPNTSTVDFWAPASNKAITSTDKDNNIGNANQTGTGATDNDGSENTNVIKSTGMTKNDGTTGTHRTHGEYQNNTNSCASCHQTHTGASKSLLFKDGVYNTCTACHDGTLGFYNVFEHSNAGTFGGTTGGNMSIHLADGTVQAKAAPGGNLSANTGAWINEFNCASCHSPHGSYSDRLLHYNPNKMGTSATKDGGIGIVGGAIVNYADLADASKTTRNINGTDVTKTAYFWAEYDKKVADSTYVSPKFISVRGTGTEVLKEVANTDVVIAVFEVTGETAKLTKTPWLYGYNHASPNKNYYTRFYDTNFNGEQAKIQKKNTSGTALYWDGAEGTSNEVTVAKNDNGSYRLPVMVLAYKHATKNEAVPAGDPNASATPWYSQTELTFDQPTGTWHYKYIVDNHDQDWTDNVVIDWKNGYIRAKDATTQTLLNALDTGDVGRAYVVDLDLQEIAKFGDANGVPIYQSNVNALYDGTKTGAGVQMSTYCASCHTDYLAKSGSATGTFNQAYRHTTTSDSYTCVRCHYAHGTDVTVMMDAEGHKVGDTLDTKGTPETTDDIIATTDYMLDQNPSSALKRYTNMSVCWGCHTDSKAEQLKNTTSYGDDNDPHGLGDQPAMPGKIKQGAVDNGSMFNPDGSQPVDPAIVTP